MLGGFWFLLCYHGTNWYHGSLISMITAVDIVVAVVTVVTVVAVVAVTTVVDVVPCRLRAARFCCGYREWRRRGHRCPGSSCPLRGSGDGDDDDNDDDDDDDDGSLLQARAQPIRLQDDALSTTHALIQSNINIMCTLQTTYSLPHLLRTT